MEASINRGQGFRPGYFLAAFAIVLGFGTVLFFQRPTKGPIDWESLGKIAVVCNGRLQPLDSVARNSLLVIHGRRSLYISEQSEFALQNGVSGRVSALRWLMEVISRPEIADKMPVFRIDHPELKDYLGLSNVGGRHSYSYQELLPVLEKIEDQAERARRLEESQRDSFQRAVLRLYYGLGLYQRLKNTIQPEGSTNFLQQVHLFLQVLPKGLEAFGKQQRGEQFDDRDLKQLLTAIQQFELLAGLAYFLPVPPDEDRPDSQAWRNVGEALLSAVHDRKLPEVVEVLLKVVMSYRFADHKQLNSALEEYQKWLCSAHPKIVAQVAKEFRYNHWQPFYQAAVFYLAAFLAAVVGWGFGGGRIWSVAMGLLGGAILLHTAGIIMRMMIEHRPPVTNLYSSAIFVGWGAALLAWVLEWRLPVSVSLATGAFVGFMSQVVAHQLSLSGDTFEVLRAVLDTNFWLATHVVTITLGYSAAYVAGMMAALFVLRGVLTRSFALEAQRPLAALVYGASCFALVFSFLGTVLGGIWADQAWGRFWGWDPKENGALLIVLWFAMMLHARSARIIGTRAFMLLAVGGNMVTTFSWFGVNMLGVGLHSYGFMSGAVGGLVAFVLANILVIGLGLLPSSLWRSALQVELHPPNEGQRVDQSD